MELARNLDMPDFGRICIHREQRLVVVDGVPARLGPRAFDVLIALVERRDRVVSKNELLDLVWPGVIVEENNLQVHISTIRKQLGQDAVATVPGRGYRLTLESANEVPAVNRMPREKTPAGAELERLRHNLADNDAVLFGREHELVTLRKLVGKHRLVSLIGPGGIGKTVLATMVARSTIAQFEDGVWLVEFASVNDADLVAGSIASAFNVRLPADLTPQSGLIAALRHRNVLLVLDNCEHLIDSVVSVTAALLDACPAVHVIATSQEVLRLPSEVPYRLSPLAVPPTSDVSVAMNYGAMELFVHAASLADRRFALGVDNIESVVEICRRLDGIALAIEMAAARIALLGVDGIRERLDERFRLLNNRHRTAVGRHQTLRATLEWSHSHLSPDEQVVFRRLGAFAGGFSLHAFARVIPEAALSEWDAIERLGNLVDKSLVVSEGGSLPRYRLLESIRAFALEQLALAGEAMAMKRRHAEWILELCEELVAVTPTLRTIDWNGWFGSELDNVRMALDWAFADGGDENLGIKLVGCSAPLFARCFVWSEGLARQEAALLRLHARTPVEVEACLWDGISIAWRTVNHHKDLAAAKRSASLWDGRNEAKYLRAMLTQARALALLLCLDQAQDLLVRIETRMAPWPALQGRFWNVYGIAAHFRQADSVTPFRRAQALFDQVGDIHNGVLARANLAEGLFAQGDGHAAEVELRAALERARLWEDPGLIGHAVGHLARMLIRQGHVVDAEPLVQEALYLLPKIGFLFGFVVYLALRAALQGRWETAARLDGYGEATFARLGHVRMPHEEGVFRRLDELLAQHLEPERAAALRAEGAGWTEHDAVAAASADSRSGVPVGP